MSSGVRVARKLDEARKSGERTEESRRLAKESRIAAGLEWDDLTQEEKLEESDREWPLSMTAKFRYGHFGILVAALVCGVFAAAIGEEKPALGGVFVVVGVILLILGVEAYLFTRGTFQKS